MEEEVAVEYRVLVFSKYAIVDVEEVLKLAVSGV